LLNGKEDEKKLIQVVTQNIYNLQTKAGSKQITKLHGSVFIIHCLNLKCHYTINKHQFQNVLQRSNPITFIDKNLQLNKNTFKDLNLYTFLFIHMNHITFWSVNWDLLV